MTARDPAALEALLGRDLRLDYRSSPGFYENAELRDTLNAGLGQRDLAVAGGVDTLRQAIANRLKTRRGELTPLGHPDYGSRHHELIGEPNVERTRNLIKLYVLQALKQERRIERVLQASVQATHVPARDTVRIELSVQVIGQHLPLEIIVPFNLSGDTA
ncbi:Phage baseplate assembly protein W [Thiothrix caldifontis]|uniref:Phage baseplate assembly protein W n=1 Tax=Thiothrix caldifontis TaxID=525918 RepID=A0A1H4ANT9_9GAMM|nr:GPW/gp25 family protein [Thiothrix caldifontis]SEA37580.1 Phage baseplate assembly protein W [Thiothrix caldifontis]